ncbi:MFS family permease [Chryseomicrobium aureum]|uniref:MFS transporter n=1 Tax=Chryseomicrobium aureum TaxID=1441723 RepID=UPI00195CC3E3|nr:MFS transporter [Chryseomicrobium aureum]MBM7707035.1 MFS family permease [Chryseomicrobium aureum]
MDDAVKLKKATQHLWTFTISKLISTFGASVYTFAISFYILQMTGSASSFAMNLIFSILPRAVLGPFAGYVVDKYNRKVIVISAQIITVLTILSLIGYMMAFGLSLPAIYTVTAILAMTSTFSGVAFSSSISSLIDETRIQKAMSLNQMSISFAAIASPAVGGILYGTVSLEVFLVLFAVASAVAVILESTMNFTLYSRRTEESERKQEEMLENMKAGLAYVKLQPILLSIMIIALSVNFMFGAFQVGYSFVLIDQLKMSAQHFGFTEAAFAIGMLLTSIYMSSRKEFKYPLLISKRGILVLGIMLAAITVPLLLPISYMQMLIFYIALMFIQGVMIIFINTPMQVYFQKTIDDDYKGRVFSLLETFAIALMPIGMVLFGVLFDVFPPEPIFLISAVILIATVLYLTRTSVLVKAHPELAKKSVESLNKEVQPL